MPLMRYERAQIIKLNLPLIYFIYLLYESYTKYKKTGKKERDRQTDNRMQSARGQIIHNVREVTDGQA